MPVGKLGVPFRGSVCQQGRHKSRSPGSRYPVGDIQEQVHLLFGGNKLNHSHTRNLHHSPLKEEGRKVQLTTLLSIIPSQPK